MYQTIDEFNRELNVIAIQALEKQMMVRDLRKALEIENSNLDKIFKKASSIREAFKSLLDNNPSEKARFLEKQKEAAKAVVPEPITTPPEESVSGEQTPTEVGDV